MLVSACLTTLALLSIAAGGTVPRIPSPASPASLAPNVETPAPTYPGPVVIPPGTEPDPGDQNPPVDVSAAVGWRDKLESAGWTMAFSSTWDASRLPDAGADGDIARGLMDVSLRADLAKVLRLPGATGFLQYLWKHGPNGSDRLGDLQGFSNIDTESFRGIGEAWIEQRLAGDRLRLKAGRVDANSEFALVTAASDFLNSSMGFSPTIAAMPTYPAPALSFNAFAALPANVTVGIGVYGESDGPRWSRPFAIGEVGTRWTSRLGGQARAGFWRKRTTEAGDVGRGVYGVVEQVLWTNADAGRMLEAFAQVGHSSSATCATDRHVGGGLIVRGLPRAGDAIGFGVTRVRSGLLADEPGGVELAFGPFVRLAVTQWLALTPDVQFIRHPGGRREDGTRAVATLRMTAGF